MREYLSRGVEFVEESCNRPDFLEEICDLKEFDEMDPDELIEV